MIRFVLATLAAMLGVSSAYAQYGAAVFVPQGPYVGAYAGPWLGYYPGAYNGFWSNGYSLYGPPVPTYGSIPGYFGGADQRLSNFPDLRANWYSPYGYRGGVVPLNPPTRFIMIAPPAVCEIHVPDPDATVTVNGTTMAGAGSVRRFESALAPHCAANCEIEAKWAGANGIGAGKRSVVMRAGETTVADFTKPGV